jgi:hypothetical protein
MLLSGCMMNRLAIQKLFLSREGQDPNEKGGNADESKAYLLIPLKDHPILSLDSTFNKQSD